MAIPRSPRHTAFGLGVALLLGFAATPALTREVPGVPSIETAGTLAPNSFIWGATMMDAAVDSAPVRVIVSIADQRAYVYRADTLIAVSAVSTGRPGHETPSGDFPILQKDVTHRSNKYSNAPMPYMQRLTWDGIALHAGHNPGYAASHGCVRLPLEFARRLFSVTQIGAEVLITEDPIELVGPVQPIQPLMQPSPMLRPAEPPVPRMILASAPGRDVTASIGSRGDAEAIRAALASVRRSSGRASVDGMVSLVY